MARFDRDPDITNVDQGKPDHVKHEVVLPPAAMEHMSDTAKQQLAVHAPHVITSPPEDHGPNVVWDVPGDNTLVGTNGEVDYFVFRLDQAIVGEHTAIQNFEPNVDVVYFQFADQMNYGIQFGTSEIAYASSPAAWPDRSFVTFADPATALAAYDTVQNGPYSDMAWLLT